MNPIIQTNHLSKSYNGTHAVKNISLTINKGEIYGFIGLNGAGKTTTIRMLLGMISPTQGECFIKNEKVTYHNYHLWEQVGYMVETPHAYPELTVEENLHIHRRLRLIKNKDVVSDVINQLNLMQYAKKKAKHLSLGNAQRLGLAKALLHQPDVLILDEPVNGLDPAGIVEIRTLLQDLAKNHGVTILISSHLLSEITKIATKIGIIHNGELIKEIESLQLHQLLNQHLLIQTKNNVKAATQLKTTGFNPIQANDDCLLLYEEQAILEPENIAKNLIFQGIQLTKLIVEEENLEQYFLRLIDSQEDD